MKTEIEILRELNEKRKELDSLKNNILELLADTLSKIRDKRYSEIIGMDNVCEYWRKQLEKVDSKIASLERQLEEGRAEEVYYEKYNLCNSCSQAFCKDRKDGKTGRVTDCTRFEQQGGAR